MTRPRGVAVLLALVAALGLTGCELRGGVVVRADGSGTFTYSLGIDKDILAGLSPEESPLAEMRRTAAAQPYPVELTGYDTKTVTGLRARFDFADPAELRLRLHDLHVNGSRLTAAFTVADLLARRTRTGWWFQARTPPRGAAVASAPAGLADRAGRRRAELRVTLPGRDRDDNAYRTWRSDGSSTFRWRIGTDTGEGSYHMRAETIRPAGSGSPWPAVLAGGVLAVAVSLGLRRRGRRRP